MTRPDLTTNSISIHTRQTRFYNRPQHLDARPYGSGRINKRQNIAVYKIARYRGVMIPFYPPPLSCMHNPFASGRALIDRPAFRVVAREIITMYFCNVRYKALSIHVRDITHPQKNIIINTHRVEQQEHGVDKVL